jgi:hypothetical protein
MPDYPAPVAAGIKPPQPMSLQDIMGIASTGLDITRRSATLQADIERAKAESRRAGIEAEVSAQTAEPRITTATQQATTATEVAKQSKLETASKHLGFNEELLNKSDAHFASILEDPSVKALADPNTPAEALPALQARAARLMDIHLGYVSALVPPEAPADALSKIEKGADLYKHIIQTDPRNFRQFVAQQQQSRLTAEGQVGQGQLPAGNQNIAGTSPVTGAPIVTSKDQFGGNVTVSPASVAPGVPNPKVGQPEMTPELSKAVLASSAAFSAAPDQHLNVRGILEEMDKVAATGTAGPAFQRLLSVSGAMDTLTHGWAGATAEQKASAYDMVGKYQERNNLQTAQAMGPHTNAGLETVRASQGSTAYNPTAIKKVTKLLDANTTGVQWYHPGLLKAVSADANGVWNKNNYDLAWGANYDPRIMMLFNAKQRGDTTEYNDIVKSLGGKNSIRYKDLMQKAGNLERLSANGRL